MTQFAGTAAVITGGSSGIGAATARRFVELGAAVVIADVDDEHGEALAAELGPASVFRHTDVSREDDVAAAVDLAIAGVRTARLHVQQRRVASGGGNASRT